MCLAGVDDNPVDIDENDFLYAGVTKDLAQRESVSTALNENALRVGMKQQWWKRQVFVIDELIQLEELNDSIQEEAAAELRNASYGYFLIGRLLTKDPLLDTQ
jgi:hypothetical protein